MKNIYLLSALLTQLSMGLNAQISFQPPVSYYGAGTNTRDITSGDFDGDGHPDSAISNTFNQTYSIFPFPLRPMYLTIKRSRSSMLWEKLPSQHKPFPIPSHWIQNT